MKSLKILAVILLLSSALTAQDRYDEIMKRTQWFREARFGMFIHFGAYSVPARGEWLKSDEKLTTEQYQKYVDAFTPTDFDAKKWAKTAKQAGMKYAVLTAKHHDGFCLWDSKLTDYKLSKQFGGRDIIREFLDAFRAEGLKVGLYYSVIDWHHPDYPNVGNHPQKGNQEWDKKKYNWDNYLKYMHGQIEELVRDYGKIDIIWYDYSFDDYFGEKWKATELIKMTHKYQPHIIIDNRLEGDGTEGSHGLKWGDFVTPEQSIPDESPKDAKGRVLPWETCLTMNNNWGFNQFDNVWKSPELLIQSLIRCVSNDGNFLLNVGPGPKGNIPEPCVNILSQIGKWMQKNGESIYSCGSCTLPKQNWGCFTQKGNNIYVHWMYPFIGPINIKGINTKAKMVTLLSTGVEPPTEKNWWGSRGDDNFFINFNKPIWYTFPLPDKASSVIKIELK